MLLIINRLACLMALSLLSFQLAAGEWSSSFRQDIINADLIFDGEVVNVSYKTSGAFADGRSGFAHTFVTYRVDHVYFGQIVHRRQSDEPRLLTLRFMGGVEGDDIYTLFSDTPLFDEGDRDLLMVQGNGIQTCPLSACRQGRFRYLNGMVFNEEGQEVVVSDNGSVQYGMRHSLPQTLTHQMGPAKLSIVHVSNPGEGGPVIGPNFGHHFKIDEFQQQLKQVLTALDVAGLLSVPSPVRSMNINDDFTVLPPTPVTESPVITERFQTTDSGFLFADRLEQSYLRRNGGNPVLDKRVAQRLQKMRIREMRRLARNEQQRLMRETKR